MQSLAIIIILLRSTSYHKTSTQHNLPTLKGILGMGEIFAMLSVGLPRFGTILKLGAALCFSLLLGNISNLLVDENETE